MVRLTGAVDAEVHCECWPCSLGDELQWKGYVRLLLSERELRTVTVRSHRTLIFVTCEVPR